MGAGAQVGELALLVEGDDRVLGQVANELHLEIQGGTIMAEENIQYTFENPEYRATYWHTCSHVMAQAVKRLWPEVKLASRRRCRR